MKLRTFSNPMPLGRGEAVKSKDSSGCLQYVPNRPGWFGTVSYTRVWGCRVEQIAQLGDTIKELCGRVVVAEGEEFDRLITQLRQALRDHLLETRKLLVRSYPAIAPEQTED